MRLTVALLVVVVLGRAASAYPIFQFSSGSDRCSDCHFSPDGGGLINAFGRSEAGSTISWTGDGRLLHGAWDAPEAFAIGGDFRAAGIGRLREGDDEQLTAFPMQADLYARAELGPISLNVTGGLNGAARNRPAGARLSTYLVSREHYVMYQATPGSFYMRAGRFFPTLGVGTADHTALVRRAIDSYTLEEPYALGGGTTGDNWELHASVFAPNPFGAGPQPFGGTALFERFIGTQSIAGQVRYAQTDDDIRGLAGTVVKQWLPGPKLLLVGELDAQVQRISGAGVARLQLLAYAGVSRVMLPGLAIGLVGQRWDPDVLLGGSARTTAQLDLQLFPIAHFELHLLARGGWSGGFTERADALGLVQVHYFL
jgi:hypothetical protein